MNFLCWMIYEDCNNALNSIYYTLYCHYIMVTEISCKEINLFPHKLDIKPIPEDVLFINDTKLADRSTFKFGLLNSGKEKDNIRIYVPLDLSKKAILLRLDEIIAIYGDANEGNESNFYIEVAMLVQQIEIYDQVMWGRHLDGSQKHSNEAIELVKEFVAMLESIPDGCSELFPFDMIDELRNEYLS